jgi:hypothetical protein
MVKVPIFLKYIFDSRIAFLPHINTLKTITDLKSKIWKYMLRTKRDEDNAIHLNSCRSEIRSSCDVIMVVECMDPSVNETG